MSKKSLTFLTVASTQTCFGFCQCFFYVFVLCCLVNFDIKSLQKETCLRWQVKTVLVHTGPVVLSLLCFKTSILQTCGDIVKERSPSTRYTVLSCSYTCFGGKSLYVEPVCTTSINRSLSKVFTFPKEATKK